MEDLFLALVKISISGTLFVLAVLLLRLLFRRAPKWVFCLLWGVVALRLIVPVSIESNFSLMPDSIANGQAVMDVTDAYVGEVDFIYEDAQEYEAAVDAGREPIYSNDGYYVVTEKDSLEAPATVESTVIPVLSRIWLAGMLLMALYTLGSYAALKRRMAAATPLRDNIRQSEKVDSPFVLGFIRPVIYLPYDMDGADMANVIAHEQAHIKRRDHWWKPIGFLILSVYWFNPVIWLAYILLCRDIEAACDEKVIKDMDKDQIRAYSTALLNCSIHRRRIAACPLAFGEVGVKERITRVMNYKKPAFWIVLLAVMASIVAAVLLLTVPVTDEQMLMGAYYHIGEELYDVQDTDSTRLSRFLITGDYYFTAQQEGTDTWLSRKKMEVYPLTAEELKNLAAQEEGWKEQYHIGQITDAYLLKKEINHFYIAAQTKDADTLLAFGSGDITGGDADNLPKLLWLYRLESDFELHEIDLDFIAHSLLGEAGIVEVTEAWESEENPGFMVAGFLAGPNHDTALGYDDMGYAVFQTNGTGYRLLSCKLYEDAVYSDNGVYVCPDPVVLSLDGEMTDSNSFDVILSCNEDLDKIQREYYKDDALVMSCASQQMGACSMTLFRWDLCPDADRVTQVFLDENGDVLTVKTDEEKILELVEQIADNPSVAHSSNPYDYITAGQELYDELLTYEERAVSCLISYLRSADADGLREYIMAAVCAELTGVGQDKTDGGWGSASQWLGLYDSVEAALDMQLDQAGTELQVGSILGIDKVWMQIESIRQVPSNPDLRRYSYRFYYHGDGKQYATDGQETDLLAIANCLDIKAGDFDGDGVVELFVHMDSSSVSYMLYDLAGAQIVAGEYTTVPDMVIDYELLFDRDGYYLYEERWAWFLKDPQTYIRELGKRPEERLYFASPSGAIPAGTDEALVDDAIVKIHELLDSDPTPLEKKIAYKIMTGIELTHAPKLIPGEDFNYSRLLEKWDYTTSESTEERNCYRQMSILFAGDPEAFLQGVAATDQKALKKDLGLVAAWLVRENSLYDAAAFESVLIRLAGAAAGDSEKAVLSLLQAEFRKFTEPSVERTVLLSGDKQQLWDTFLYAPEKVIRSIGDTDSSMKDLGQALWGVRDSGSVRLLDRAYEAVNKVLSEKPTGALKDVAYQFLLALEWQGGYRDEIEQGKRFDYQRLFDKWTYSDGAMTTNCIDQMLTAFWQAPAAFVKALAVWDETAEAPADMGQIALSFAYEHYYRNGEQYELTLAELETTVTTEAEKRCVAAFWEEYRKLVPAAETAQEPAS